MNFNKIISLVAGTLFCVATTSAAGYEFHPFKVALSPSAEILKGSGAIAPALTKQEANAGPLRKGENNPLQPPFCETFDNFRKGMEHDDFRQYFDVIDSNGDGCTWGLYNYAGERPYGKCSYMNYPSTGDFTDDWLITRAVKLEKGKYYCISVYGGLYLDDNDNTPQIYEVKVGTYNDAAGMKYEVIPATKVYSSTMKRAQGWFTPPFTATYYVGVHGITPVYKGSYYNYLFIDNISVESPLDAGVPAEVTDVEMANDPDGTPAVIISFKAPTVTLEGKPLTQLSSITVKRDGVVVATVNPAAPGKQYSVKDTPDKEGYYEYSITANGVSGEGATYYKGHTAGVGAPLPPTVTSYKELPDGKIRMTWNAPATDVNGSPLNPEKITYSITDQGGDEEVIVATDLNTLEYTYDPKVPAGWQRLVFCLITAKINGRASDPAVTDYLPVGTPYKLPYHNSFTYADYYDYIMSVEMVPDVTWGMFDDFSDPKPQDGDNGFVSMVGNQPDQSCELRTGKIDLREASAPLLTFYTYIYKDDENTIDVNVYDVETGKKTTLYTVDCYEYEKVDWHQIVVSLKDFAGKVIVLGIDGKIKTHGYIPIDNMTIKDMEAVDLAAGIADYDRDAGPDEPINITGTVFNTGRTAVSGYTVTLLAGNREVMTVDGPTVAPLETVTVKLSDTFNSVSPVSTAYRVRVNAEGDTNSDNDISDPVTVAFLAPVYPTVSDLTGVEAENGEVTLTWSAPDMSNVAPEEVVEDFEKYDPFETNLDGWSMYDGDKGYIGGFKNIDMPVSHTQQAFWIFTYEAGFEFIPTHSGYNVISSMYTTDEDFSVAVANDDWLISPELYGGRQNITFYVMSPDDSYGNEEFEVYYSLSGKNVDDFKCILPKTEAPTEWMRVRIALPEGTKYFAVRYVSKDKYFFVMDDFSYIPVGTPRALTLQGYNVYRNGVKLNSELLNVNTYQTSRDKIGDTYYVTAVYDKGESAGSNSVHLGEDGIENVVVTPVNTAPVEYYDLRGVKINPSTAIPGIYIRRAGSKVDKVVIR